MLLIRPEPGTSKIHEINSTKLDSESKQNRSVPNGISQTNPVLHKYKTYINTNKSDQRRDDKNMRYIGNDNCTASLRSPLFCSGIGNDFSLNWLISKAL